MKEIKRACSRYAIMFRINVGTGKTYDGRYFSTGVPRGFSDLFGVRRSDGKAIFIEVKTAKGRLSKNQTEFLDAVKSTGVAYFFERMPCASMTARGFWAVI